MTHSTSKPKLDYKQAGVDIAAGDRLVQNIKPHVKKTFRPEVLTHIGGFGGLFQLNAGNYRQPVLVSGTDGVGTKLRVADSYDKHDTIGIDLVAMCANDIVVSGAEPLFFLDYFATSKLNPDLATTVIKGIANGCQQAGCALIGGETAEMPGMYQSNDYDLAGFCVGVVEREEIIDGTKIKEGQRLIALPSSGLHSNGFSLVRKILEIKKLSLTAPFEKTQQELGDLLLTPTEIYVKTVLALKQQHPITGMAHITGGGILENLPRILPEHLSAVVDTQTWQWPTLFKWLQQTGDIDTAEMYRTFNCGVGMILVVPKDHAQGLLSQCHQLNISAWELGVVNHREGKSPAVVFS